MRNFLLPSTDAGVFVQVVAMLMVWVGLLVIVRGSAEARLLVGGIGMITLGWFGLRALH
ncbi:MAG: hypothetical protein ABR540_06295 [Acidimicrobiales bacterium]